MRYNFIVKTIMTVAVEAESETQAFNLICDNIKGKISSCMTLSRALGFEDGILDHEKIKDTDLVIKAEKKGGKREKV